MRISFGFSSRFPTTLQLFFCPSLELVHSADICTLHMPLSSHLRLQMIFNSFRLWRCPPNIRLLQPPSSPPLLAHMHSLCVWESVRMCACPPYGRFSAFVWIHIQTYVSTFVCSTTSISLILPVIYAHIVIHSIHVVCVSVCELLLLVVVVVVVFLSVCASSSSSLTSTDSDTRSNRESPPVGSSH